MTRKIKNVPVNLIPPLFSLSAFPVLWQPMKDDPRIMRKPNKETAKLENIRQTYTLGRNARHSILYHRIKRLRLLYEMSALPHLLRPPGGIETKISIYELNPSFSHRHIYKSL